MKRYSGNTWEHGGEKSDLVYSTHDQGWYWARWGDGATSQVFETKDVALGALENSKIKWEKW